MAPAQALLAVPGLNPTPTEGLPVHKQHCLTPQYRMGSDLKCLLAAVATAKLTCRPWPGYVTDPQICSPPLTEHKVKRGWHTVDPSLYPAISVPPPQYWDAKCPPSLAVPSFLGQQRGTHQQFALRLVEAK